MSKNPDPVRSTWAPRRLLQPGDFVQSGIGQLLAIKCTSSEQNSITLELPAGASALNPDGIVHGGAIATLVDIAATAVVWTDQRHSVEQEIIVTASLSIGFVAAGRGTLEARGRIVGGGRSLKYVAIEVTSRDGTIANAMAVMRIRSRRA